MFTITGKMVSRIFCIKHNDHTYSGVPNKCAGTNKHTEEKFSCKRTKAQAQISAQGRMKSKSTNPIYSTGYYSIMIYIEIITH